MKAVTILSVTAVALLAAVVPAPANALPGLLEPCMVTNFMFPPPQLVATSAGEHAVIEFTVDEAFTGNFWAAIALHWARTANAGVGYAAERAMPIGFIETATGAPVAGPIMMVMYPYGAHVSVPEVSVRAAAADGSCGTAAGGTSVALAPGDYRFIIFGATDSGSGAGAFIPQDVTITRVTRGPAYRLSEPELECDVKLRAEVMGVTTSRLEGCAATVDVAGTAYRGIGLGRFRDADHDVRWRTPAGDAIPVSLFDGGHGPGGAWSLEVPRYVTPFGSGTQPGFIGSLPRGDGGVFGAIADVA